MGGLLHLVSALPIFLFCLIDARRRPLSATMAYAAALCFSTAWALGHTRAFAPLVPGASDTAVSLILALAAAVGGGYLGNRLAAALAGDAADPAPR